MSTWKATQLQLPPTVVLGLQLGESVVGGNQYALLGMETTDSLSVETVMEDEELVEDQSSSKTFPLLRAANAVGVFCFE